MPSSTILGCSRTPAAATSSTPASLIHPSPSHLALRMRKSEGYALVPLARESDAPSASPACPRRALWSPPAKLRRADVAT